MNRQPSPHYAFLDGLKGIAIVMIVAFHLQFIYSGFSDYLSKLLAFSGVWVNMFFVISAFTLTASVYNQRLFNFFRYFYKRFLRITPAYYVMLVIAFIVMPTMVRTFLWGNNIQNLFQHILFINTAPFNHTNQVSILGVEWYIPVQFWLYLVIPFIVITLRGNGIIFSALLLVSLFLHSDKNALFHYQNFFDFASSIQNFLWVYVFAIGAQMVRMNKKIHLSFSSIITGLGILAGSVYFILTIQTKSERFYITALIVMLYQILLKTRIIRRVSTTHSSLVPILEHIDVLILFILFYKYILNWYFVKNPHEFMAFWSIALVIASYARPWFLQKLLENRAVVLLGKYSYEIYLTHFFVITAVGYIIPKQGPYIRTLYILPIIAILSYLLRQFVSKPALDLYPLKNQ